MIDPADKPMYYAYAYRSGVVRVGRRVPARAIIVASSPSRYRLRGAVDMCARIAYDGRTRLVPGVPEAADDAQACNAAALFGERIRRYLTHYYNTMPTMTTTSAKPRTAGIRTAVDFAARIDELAIVSVQLRQTTAERDADLQAVRDRYAGDIAELGERYKTLLAETEAYASRRRSSLLPGDAKSAETTQSRWGWRLGRPVLALLSHRHTWRSVCAKLLQLGRDDCVKVADPVPRKDRIKELDETTLAAIGCRVEQEEVFWAAPKDREEAL